MEGLIQKYKITAEDLVEEQKGWKKRITRKVDEQSNKDWKMRAGGKENLQVYKHKNKKEFNWYWTGDKRRIMLLKAWADDLIQTGVKSKGKGGIHAHPKCRLCQAREEESTIHLVAECTAYEEIRQEAVADIHNSMCEQDREAWLKTPVEGQVAVLLSVNDPTGPALNRAVNLITAIIKSRAKQLSEIEAV